MDRRNSINMKRIALANIFNVDHKVNPENPGLTIADISTIMFETQDIQVQNYFYYKLKRKEELPGTRLELLIDESEDGSFRLNEHSSSYLPERLRSFAGPKMISEIFDVIRNLEKDELAADEKLNADLENIREDTDFGLSVITQNYEQFLDKVSGDERKKFVEGLKKRKPNISPYLKLISRAAPAKTYELLRLGLDAWAYSIFDLLLAQQLAEKIGMKYRLDENVVRQTAQMIIESQHESLGSWAIGDYDYGFQTIDTGLVIQLLYLIKANFSNISIPESTLELARNFILKSIHTFDGKTGKISYCKVERSGKTRQNTLLATGYALATLYRIHQMKEKKNFLDEKIHSQLLRYLIELKDDTGAFRMTPDAEYADLESTSLITKSLLGKRNMNLTPEDIESATGLKFDPIKTLGYFQSQRSRVSEYIAQGDLNVAADTIHSTLCCGAIPLSTHIIEKMVEISKKSKDNFLLTKDYDFWAWFKSPASKWSTFTTYSIVIKSVHVIHESLFFLDLLDDYISDPSSYWTNLGELLRVHKS